MSHPVIHTKNIEELKLETIQAVYFIGIGGIGMSALAKYFLAKGKQVYGYDKTQTKLTQELETMGAKIHYEENLDKLIKQVQLVVYTPAISSSHIELQYYIQNNYVVIKRSDVLQLITRSTYNICIAGTHGKTTISTMIAHILRDSGFGCNAFLGGIAANYGTNFWGHENEVCVIEADEYDRSFLKLFPDLAIISSMDADHLDIYGSAQAVEKAFIDFSQNVKAKGCLIYKLGLKEQKQFTVANFITYSLETETADVFATNINKRNGGYQFDVVIKGKKIENVLLNMGGLHNVENVVAAIAVATYLKISNESIMKAVESFLGVKRRFEYISKTDAIVQIDDYAHHPEELRSLIRGVKNMFPEKKCTIIFQPHLYSRTRDFANEFATVLDGADEIILLPIYPARELPMEGVESKMIATRMKNKCVQLMTKEELLNWMENKLTCQLENELSDVLVTAGAGDIDLLIEPIKRMIEKR